MRGNKYELVLYHHNTNAILAKALNSCLEYKLINTQIYIDNYLKVRGFILKIQILDN